MFSLWDYVKRAYKLCNDVYGCVYVCYCDVCLSHNIGAQDAYVISNIRAWVSIFCGNFYIFG